MPLPLLNKDPINIEMKIILEVAILKWIPIIDPNIKKKIITGLHLKQKIEVKKRQKIILN